MVAEKKLAVVVRTDRLDGYLFSEVVDLDSVRDFAHDGVVIDRMKNRMRFDAGSIRSRAKSLAKLLGCPLIDETKPAEPEVQKPDATEELLAAIEKLRGEIRELHGDIRELHGECSELWTAIAHIDRKAQP